MQREQRGRRGSVMGAGLSRRRSSTGCVTGRKLLDPSNPCAAERFSTSPNLFQRILTDGFGTSHSGATLSRSTISVMLIW